MTTAFEAACRVFSNAERFVFKETRLKPFPPVDAISREVLRLFRVLADVADDPAAATVRARLSRLRTTVLCSLLPFHSPELQLGEQTRALRAAGASFPDIRAGVAALLEAVEFLQQHPINPKREVVFGILQAAQRLGERYPVGLVFPFSPGGTPGWGGDLTLELHQFGGCAEPVFSPKSLLARTYSQLILPWGGRGCRFLQDLHYSFRSPVLQAVHYSSERLCRPDRPALPRGSAVSFTRPPDHLDTPPVEFAEDEVDASEALWQAMGLHRSSRPGHDTEDDRAFLVPARLVLLANGARVFLREGSKVLELSEILDGRGDLDASRLKFPRVAVSDLKPGDLIVLRTVGSGHYLIDVADRLMQQDGLGDLRARALDWKPALRAALETHGSEKIADQLARKGHTLASGHRYIWVWATDEVIRPESDSLFYELLAILQDLGFLEADALTTAEERLKPNLSGSGGWKGPTCWCKLRVAKQLG